MKQVFYSLAYTLLGCCSLFMNVGCAHRPKSTPPAQTPPIAVHTKPSPKPYEQELTESVRFQEQVKAYPVGRYIDPNDPNILHEAHVLYRREQPARWNRTLQKPTVLPLGPTFAVVDPALLKSPISETLERAFVEQTELMKQLQEQNEALDQKISTLEEQLKTLNTASHAVPSATH